MNVKPDTASRLRNIAKSVMLNLLYFIYLIAVLFGIGWCAWYDVWREVPHNTHTFALFLLAGYAMMDVIILVANYGVCPVINFLKKLFCGKLK